MLLLLCFAASLRLKVSKSLLLKNTVHFSTGHEILDWICPENSSLRSSFCNTRSLYKVPLERNNEQPEAGLMPMNYSNDKHGKISLKMK